MKTIGLRARFLYFFAAVFVVGISVFLIRYFISGADWSSQPYNGHLSVDGEGKTELYGTITDRNGTVLAATDDTGTRTYHADSLTREALLHTVGDNDGYISTSLQSIFRAQLSGYNVFLGLNRKSGSNLSLTLDSDLCRYALSLFGYQKGAALVYNYKTGEILCKITSPTFDPLNVPSDLETNSFYEGVYLDRTLSAAYTPGSTFKIVTTACAIENLSDWESLTFTCNGRTTLSDGTEVTCLEHHGEITIDDALAGSCNVFFAELAEKLGAEKLEKTATEMGFNRSFSFYGAETAKSVCTLSGATAGELGWAGVGQNTDSLNPYHALLLMGAIANGGVPIKPYLIQNMTSPWGIPQLSGRAQNETRLLSAEVAGKLKELMRKDVTDHYGDGFFPSGMEVCAKTGTAEVGDGKEDTAWIVGFCQNENTPYAFVVVVEEGGYGLSRSGTLASSLLSYLVQN